MLDLTKNTIMEWNLEGRYTMPYDGVRKWIVRLILLGGFLCFCYGAFRLACFGDGSSYVVFGVLGMSAGYMYMNYLERGRFWYP